MSSQMRGWRRLGVPVEPADIAALATMLEEGEHVPLGRTIASQGIDTKPLYRGRIGTPVHSVMFLSEDLKR